MNIAKSILAFSALFLLIGILPAWAQQEGRAANPKEVRLSDKTKTAFMKQLRALKDLGPTARRATQSIALKNIRGFNLGMPGFSNKVIHIIFFHESGEVIPLSHRSGKDGFKASSGLGDSFKHMGIDPARSMLFQFNTETLRIEPFSGPSGTGKH